MFVGCLFQFRLTCLVSVCNTYSYTHILTHPLTPSHSHIHPHIHTPPHIHMHPHIRTHTVTYSSHPHTYTHLHIHTHALTSTHSPSLLYTHPHIHTPHIHVQMQGMGDRFLHKGGRKLSGQCTQFLQHQCLRLCASSAELAVRRIQHLLLRAPGHVLQPGVISVV